ncbi:MAG: 30S ribosomal protein S17 [Dehalococcoidia bacterium]|nr:30S ribosomal protein S17 [Dehalococcoidia bacterium]
MLKNRKTRVGRVVSDKMERTVVVAVETAKQHPLYRRVIRRTSRIKAHDEDNVCRLGDMVRVMESRPISKDKSWKVVEVLTKGDVAEVKAADIE